jgi:hypothetical protein
MPSHRHRNAPTLPRSALLLQPCPYVLWALATGRQRTFDARKSDRRGDIVGLDLGLSFAGVAAYVYWVGGIGVVWYAVEYRVPTDKVYIDPKPTDCDFWRAPLGYKGCHYEDWFSLNTQRGAVEQTLPKRVSRSVDRLAEQ